MGIPWKIFPCKLAFTRVGKVGASNLKLARTAGYLDAHLNLAIYLDCAPGQLSKCFSGAFNRFSGSAISVIR